MPEPEGRYEKKQPRNRNNYKQKRQLPPRTAQMLNYVKKKRQAEQKKKQDAANNEYAVNEAENAAIDTALETANTFSRATRKQSQDSRHNAASHSQQHHTEPTAPYGTASHEPSHSAIPSGSHTANPSSSGNSASGQSRIEPKLKPAFEPKTRASAQRTSPRIGRPDKAASAKAVNASTQRAVDLGRAKFRQDAQRELVRQSKQTAKAAGELAKKTAAAAVNAIRSTAGLLAGACGGAVLAVVIGVILLVGAVAASPFGVLFSTNPTEDATTLATAMAQIDQEYAMYDEYGNCYEVVDDDIRQRIEAKLMYGIIYDFDPYKPPSDT